jgi:hypothetical protein
MRLSNFFIESIGLYLPKTYRTESAVADGYLHADTREKTARSPANLVVVSRRPPRDRVIAFGSLCRHPDLRALTH